MKAAAIAFARKVAGLVLLLVGIALLILPGPGWPFIFAGATLLGYGPEVRALAAQGWRRLRAWSGR